MSSYRWLSDEQAHNLSNISASFLVWTSLYISIYSRKTSSRIIEKSPNRLKRQELGVKIASIFTNTKSLIIGSNPNYMLKLTVLKVNIPIFYQRNHH